MKAISLWQPWASLMALGLKKNEIRSWSTNYRGPLLIHAAKKVIPWPSVFIQAVFDHIAFQPPDLPRGVLCKVNLIDCVRIFRNNKPNHSEVKFGDYTEGRYMWVTTDLTVFNSPIPFPGKQGLFDIPDEILVTRYL